MSQFVTYRDRRTLDTTRIDLESEPSPGPRGPSLVPGHRHVDAPARLARAVARPLRQALHGPLPVHAAVRDPSPTRRRSRRSSRPRPTCSTRARARGSSSRSSGRNSVILLDGDAHMEQRKLMLPAFHGERMERLADLVERGHRRRGRGLGARREIELHPRLQALTLEIILRAVFGLDPGPRLDALRDEPDGPPRLRRQPAQPDPGADDPERLERQMRRFNAGGPFKGFLTYRDRTDELIAELIDERRAAGDRARRRARDAARGPPRGRLADVARRSSATS